MATEIRIDRRRFLAASAGATALVIGFRVPWPKGVLAGDAPSGPPAPAKLPPPNAFLRIGADESVTVLLAHSEMGQGIWTTLPILVAEELECDWSKIKVEHAPAAPVYGHTAYHVQMTGGSTTTWSEFDRYRQVGALARTLLVQAAAARWKVDPSACRAEDGFVVSGDRRLSFGALAAEAAKATPPDQVTLKPRETWKRIGKPTPRLDSRAKVTGRAEFGIDVRVPGLMVAVVRRAPVFGGKVKSFSAEKASAVPGVKKVVQVPSGVAVVAETFWAAKRGRDLLEVEWDLGPGATVDTTALAAEYRRLAGTPGTKSIAAGSLATTGTASPSSGRDGKTFEADYEAPYLAHATMEPMNATVRAAGGKAEVWAPTQFQTMDQGSVARVFGLKPEDVQVHTTFLGGGFGRRATASSDVVTEAAHVAKESGFAVKVVWTREDDTQGGYYRPQYLHRVRVRLGADGAPAAWHQTIVGQSILAGTPFEAAMVKGGIDTTSVEGVSDSPYVKGTPDHLVELHSPKNAVPVLWWRSVGHSHSAFAMECAIDELAALAGVDPLAYRRRLLAAHPRHLAALDLAASKHGFGTETPKGVGRGIAVHESFGSVVAVAVDVTVEGGAIRVRRATSAVDCGTCVNPLSVKAQLEGAVAFGLSAALYGELTLKEGRVQESNFHDYPLLRIADMPRVQAFVVDSTAKPGGVGEPGVPPVAPAVANAVFAVTGKRHRRLPLRLA
jgi:isoquinoline 1-oxidoreductase beta subunit